jgi:hypothetical protein
MSVYAKEAQSRVNFLKEVAKIRQYLAFATKQQRFFGTVTKSVFLSLSR